MKYNIKAIPTTYAGVNFRSRLEARWAAFFDLCGWKWDYEPFDLDGWAPDFMLKGKVKALVEVKPIDFSANENVAFVQARTCAEKAFSLNNPFEESCVDDMTEEQLDRYMDLCRRPPSHYEVLIVGNGPFATSGLIDWGLGVFAIEEWGGDMGNPDIAILYHGDRTRLDYAAQNNSYRYRVSGSHEGDGHLRPIGDNTPEQLWREAGNLVQWKRKAA